MLHGYNGFNGDPYIAVPVRRSSVGCHALLPGGRYLTNLWPQLLKEGIGNYLIRDRSNFMVTEGFVTEQTMHLVSSQPISMF